MNKGKEGMSEEEKSQQGKKSSKKKGRKPVQSP